MDYFISDFHNMDKNMLIYEHRPFKNIDEMRDAIVSNCNQVVTDKDRLFILGDIGDSEILNDLNGEIIIVIGNHDNYNNLKKQFPNLYISKYPIMVEGLWLSHEPITFLPKECPYLNVHGHLHSLIYGAEDRTWLGGNRYFNVSVERVNYTPISMLDIATLMQYS